MMTLLFECGLMGIGAFWVLVEILHQQPSGEMREEEVKRYLDFYGKQGEWSDDMLGKCQRIMYSTGLLINKDGFVSSSRVKSNLKTRKQLILNKKQAAARRWNGDARAMQQQCSSNAINEMKVNEKKQQLQRHAFDERFETFWKTYPKKIGKGAAEKAWSRISSVEAVFEKIVGAVAVQVRSEQWLKDGGQFIPHPATWLNQRRWEDEVTREKVVG